VGEEADAAGRDDAPPVAIAVQVPDAVPAMPPPSKLDIPALDVPMADGAAVAKHPVGTSLGAMGDAPGVSGLIPGDAISVAPSGMPVGATGKPGPIPSGEVASSGEIESVPVIWANAALQPKSTASIAAINTRPMIGSFSLRQDVRLALRSQPVAHVQDGGPLPCHLLDFADFVSGLLRSVWPAGRSPHDPHCGKNESPTTRSNKRPRDCAPRLHQTARSQRSLPKGLAIRSDIHCRKAATTKGEFNVQADDDGSGRCAARGRLGSG
jgi:hypothetical protein